MAQANQENARDWDAKRREAEKRGESFQEEPAQRNIPYPKTVFLILGNEFCERLSYYGMKSILSIYISQKLHFDHDRSTSIYHTFSMLCYFCPMFGAMIADQFLGKFKTIVYISIIYVLGHLLKTLAAVPNIGVPPVEFSLIGLLLIAIGTGGIKPCVVAFGGDQFKLPEQERQLQSFFSVFYFCINLGALIGTFMTPILREDVHCFGEDTCFSLAFGVPGVLMAVAVVIIIIGKSQYNMVPPQGSILVKVFGSIFYALKQFAKGNRAEEHWMDLSTEKYGKEIVSDVKALLKVLVMYIPVPVFWALFDQSGSRWTFQATGMDGTFGSTRIKPDQMQIVNPILVMVFIPIFDKIVYPFFAKFNLLKKPLQRMAVGGVITACSFFASGFLELQMQPTYAKVPKEDFSNIHVMNSIPCMVSVRLHHNNELVYEETIEELHNHVIYDIEAGHYLFDMKVEGGCLSGQISESKGEVSVETHSHKVSAVHLGLEGGSVFPTVLNKFDDPHKDAGGKGMVKAVYNLGSASKNTWKNLTLMDSAGKKHLIDGLEFEGISSSNYTKLNPDDYKVYLDSELLGNFTVGQGGVYSLLLTRDSQTNDVKFLKYMLTTPNIIHMLWLLPQIIIITIGEILFSITGIEFAYSQAPESMKSVVQAFWLWTTAFGNVIVILVAESKGFDDRASEFFMFACLMLVDMALFIALAYRYKPKEEEKRTEDLNMNSMTNNAYNHNE